VAADNSCLFAAVGLLVRGSRSAAADLRAVVAAAVLADPDTWSEAVLECPPAQYAAKIAAPDTWGGAVDLAILAAWAGVELAAAGVLELAMAGRGRRETVELDRTGKSVSHRAPRNR
jgi:ubiquitin thioesterase OTU1